MNGTHAGIHWDTAYIYKICVCMPNNLNNHRPRIIKFAHNLSCENSMNALSLIFTIKLNSDYENFKFIYQNQTY